MAQDLKSTAKNSIYQYDQIFDQVYKAMKRDLSPENYQLLQKYDHEMVNQSLAKATRLKHLKVALSLSKMIQKDWKDVTKDNIDALVYKIMQTYATDAGKETETSRDFKKVLKIFFRWFKLGSRSFDEVGDPVETKKIKLKQVECKVVREDLITEADRTALLNACEENARDRALIDCHFEAGTRPGEILSLKIKHVKFDDFGSLIMVDGKTGTRSVRLIRSTPNLANWIDKHPFRNNPETPLWIMFEKTVYGQAMTYSAARKMINKRCLKADLPKRVYLNLFRHSEATESAKFLNEINLRKRHGWRPSSKMPERYTHLLNADLDRAILEHHGLIPKSDDKKAKLPRMCHICKTPNGWDSKLCTSCGKALDLATAIEIEEKEKADKEQNEKEFNYGSSKANMPEKKYARLLFVTAYFKAFQEIIISSNIDIKKNPSILDPYFGDFASNKKLLTIVNEILEDFFDRTLYLRQDDDGRDKITLHNFFAHDVWSLDAQRILKGIMKRKQSLSEIKKLFKS